MAILFYVVYGLGPEAWPIPEDVALTMLYEMALECALLWGCLIYGSLKRFGRL